MAFRQIINKVLRRLRESQISADWIVDLANNNDVDEYHQLIGDFVNEAKETVEDTWTWSVLRSVVDVPTVAATASYTITGATERSKVLQVMDNTNNCMLSQMSDAAYYKYLYGGTTTDSIPTYYRLNGNTITLYPTPAGVYDIKVHIVIPQGELTEAATELTVPEVPVVLGAYALALAERGEDGGTSIGVADMRFNSALTDAVNHDHDRTINETVWYAN